MRENTRKTQIGIYHDPYRSQEILTFQQAIDALGLDENEKKLYQDETQLNHFRIQLESRLHKTKLWNYAPHQREAVKKARAYLQQLLGIELSYQ